MSESTDKIRVDLCPDHFQRLCGNNPCVTCPSRVENEQVCKAMSQILDRDSDQIHTAVVTELQSIRRGQADQHGMLNRLQEAIFGNGKPGIGTRLTIIETKLATNNRNIGTTIAIIGVIVSCILSVVGLIK